MSTSTVDRLPRQAVLQAKLPLLPRLRDPSAVLERLVQRFDGFEARRSGRRLSLVYRMEPLVMDTERTWSNVGSSGG